jgi:hypothetical protein
MTSRSNESNKTYKNNTEILNKQKQKIAKLFLWKANWKISKENQIKRTKIKDKKRSDNCLSNCDYYYS